MTEQLANSRVIVPLRNGGQRWREAAAALAAAVDDPRRVLVVDSESTDGSLAAAQTHGFETWSIRAADFNHGKTRQDAIDRCGAGTRFVVLLTHDAVLGDRHSLTRLLDSFDDASVGAAFGRQTPHLDAEPFEAHGVLFNYAAESSKRTLADTATLGIKTAYLSNSFAAYRVAALHECGGFPNHLILGEDAFVAMQLLLRGWAVQYRADATVRHSHRYSIGEEFQRYFDFGVLHAQLPELLAKFGGAEGEGLRYVVSELRHIAGCAPHKLPLAPIRSVAKYLGYRLGRHHDHLRPALKKRFSMTKVFWDSVAGRALSAPALDSKRARP